MSPAIIGKNKSKINIDTCIVEGGIELFDSELTSNNSIIKGSDKEEMLKILQKLTKSATDVKTIHILTQLQNEVKSPNGTVEKIKEYFYKLPSKTLDIALVEAIRKILEHYF